MGSTSKSKFTKRLAATSPISSPPSIAEPVDPPTKRLHSDSARPAATTDSCSRCDNSEASDCESDFLCESSVEGAPEDETLKRSEALTQEEVVQRRARRVRQLMKLYRTQYWGLLEEMRTKYRRFYLRHGKSGWREDAEEAERDQDGNVKVGEEGGDGMREPEKGTSEHLHCGSQGCSGKPLPLSVFCFTHILLEPRQRLYKPCSYVLRTGQNGAVTCARPVLRAMVPPLCGVHFHQAQRQAARSLKKVLPGSSTKSSTPKLHLIISQYVNYIQNRRRKVLKNSSTAAPAEKGGEGLPHISSISSLAGNSTGSNERNTGSQGKENSSSFMTVAVGST